MQRTPVDSTILRPIVIGVDISFRELRACNIYISSLLLSLPDWAPERSNIPDAQLSIVGDGDHSVGYLCSHHIQSVDGVLVPLGGETCSIGRQGFCSEIPLKELPIITPSEDNVCGVGEELGRGDHGLAEAVELWSVP